VIDSQAQAVLQAVVRRESLSLLSYAGDAFPWATAREEEALHALRQLVHDERQAVVDLGRYLARHRVAPPPLGSYPSHYTTMNFISLDYLLPRLRDEERALIVLLERDVASLKQPEAQALVKKLLEVKKRDLQELERLASLQGEPANA
jgi:hypothetical protein